MSNRSAIEFEPDTLTAPFRVNNNAIIIDANGLIVPWADVEKRMNAHDELVAALRLIASAEIAGSSYGEYMRGIARAALTKVKA